MKNSKFEDLYYTAPGGERKLKRYVVAVLIIGVLMVAAIAWVIVQRSQIRAHMAYVPPTITATSTSVQSSTTDPTQIATQIATLAPVVSVSACPTDPPEWTLTEPAPGNQYERIDPACVYDGLGRAIAWSLAIQMGYSRADANDGLGFSFDASKNNPAMVALSNVTILTYSNWAVAQIGLDSAPMTAQFTEWAVTPDGAPAVTDTILGCFLTTSMGDGYPILCVIAEDTQAGYHVITLGGHLYTGGVKANRVLSVFGYASDGRWVWLGNEHGVDVDQSGISQAVLQKGYRDFSEGYNAPIWNAQWLKTTFGISLKPLPTGWQAAKNASELQIILGLLNSQ
jgi:hypothetical protein